MPLGRRMPMWPSTVSVASPVEDKRDARPGRVAASDRLVQTSSCRGSAVATSRLASSKTYRPGLSVQVSRRRQ